MGRIERMRGSERNKGLLARREDGWLVVPTSGTLYILVNRRGFVPHLFYPLRSFNAGL